MSSSKISITEIEPDNLDGILVLQAALSRQQNISLYPRQVMIIEGNGDKEMTFIHGLPGSSGLAPVTYAQDKRMRRALLESNGLPVPKGATFTIGRGIKDAKRFAKQIGFPVVLKPSIGDNGIETFNDINDLASMERALDYLQTPTTERKGFSRAAYGLTELREPGVEDGKLVVPPGYLFMVEKQLSGDYLRILTINGKVASVIDCDGMPSNGSFSGGVEILRKAPDTVIEVAENAARSIPGLGVVAIDLITTKSRLRRKTSVKGIVEYSERPALWIQAKVDPHLATKLADRILSEYAESKHAQLPAPAEKIEVTFKAFAIPDAKQATKSFVAAASDFGVEIQVDHTDQIEGTIGGIVSGHTFNVALFTDSLLAGDIDEVPVMLAKLSDIKTKS